jgi:hypothetical protein
MEGEIMSSNATSSPSGPEAAPETHGSQFGIYVAFVPWVLFSLITQRDTLKAAAVVALVASILMSRADRV